MAKDRNASAKKQRPPPPHGHEIADRRANFARQSRKSGRDVDAERAFIEHKMELVKSDPQLTESEKREALEELTRKLVKPPR